MEPNLNPPEKNYEIKKADILKWTAALRSGKYKQTKNELQTQNGFCCLGVACKIFIKPRKLRKRTDGTIIGTGPDAQYDAPLWLKEINDDFGKKVQKNQPESNDLMGLNDSGALINGFTTSLTFDEIADCLEAVYIHKVLEPITKE